MSETPGGPVSDDSGALLAAYERVRQYIDVDLVRLIPRPNDPEGKAKAARAFNHALCDPQRSFPSIQVAGTSGKGSTAHMLARILAAAGYRTGLHTSPYLQVMTEKTWISGQLIGGSELESACERIRGVAEHYRSIEDFPASVHGLASMALSTIEFERRRVDVAVIETCVGGRYDIVQGLDKALTVITDIGLDHTHVLGHSLEEIAWHKAGIMEGGIPCVASVSGGFGAIEAESRQVGCPLIGVTPAPLDGSPPGDGAVLRLPGFGEVTLEGVDWPIHQQRNALLAAAAAFQLCRRGWRIDIDHVSRGLAGPGLPGRMEWMSRNPGIILDGAHNPQKVRALWSSLPSIKGKLVLLLGVTGERHPEHLLQQMLPKPDRVVCTQPVLYGKPVVEARYLAACAGEMGLDAVAIPDSREALRTTLEDLDEDDLLVVTGSLYLLGEIRSYWYPASQVILQQTWNPRS